MTDDDGKADRLIELIRRLAPQAMALVDDPKVTDVMLNSDGSLYEDRLGVGMSKVGTMTPLAALMFIQAVAGMVDATITRENPILECRLYNGARFTATVEPVSAPCFAIRTHAKNIFTLADYVDGGMMTCAEKRALETAVAQRDNIIIAGGTGSGKTTLGNAIAHEIDRTSPDDRVAIVEETGELQFRNKNVMSLQTTTTVNHLRLLRTLMRLRPDRIIIGEVRGGETLEMLKAWNTGHEGGFCTCHANSARDTLIRIEQMIQEVSVHPMQQLIAAAVDVIVFIAREGTARRVREVVRLTGYVNGEYQFTPIE